MHLIEKRPSIQAIYIMFLTCQWRHGIKYLFAIGFLIFFCEFAIYYFVLLQCKWPALNASSVDVTIQESRYEPLKLLFLADTHLLGWQKGHWFDKVRREWQIERSFQTTMSIHNPDNVFILGDLLDEGKWCGDAEFKYHVNRFRRIFRHSTDTAIHVVAGNHDIGFHYGVSRHKYVRFREAFRAPSVRMLTINGNIFVLVNSMAFEGDGCFMCKEAEKRLQEIAVILKCAKKGTYSGECEGIDKITYSRPFLIQHFPLYRASDSNCTGSDSAPPDEKEYSFRPKWDCLSKDATQNLLKVLDPRLVITAHTHNGCFTTHRANKHILPEWTVASYSWRNKKQPTFLLAVVANNNFVVHKCYLPHEDTVIWTYVIGIFIVLGWFILPKTRLLSKKPNKFQ